MEGEIRKFTSTKAASSLFWKKVLAGGSGGLVAGNNCLICYETLHEFGNE